VRNRKGELISIPNAVAVAERVLNYSRAGSNGGLILCTSVTIGYEAPWRQVHAMLITAASRTAGLRMEPPPFVLQKSLSDFYVEYEFNVQSEGPSQRPFVLSALHSNIQDSFNEHGVQILVPHYESQPATSVFVPKERWHAAPAPPANLDLRAIWCVCAGASDPISSCTAS
jgi:small-conductance mechanosensitive channel